MARVILSHAVCLLALFLLVTTLTKHIRSDATHQVEFYTYEVVAEYPHDPDAFTQGIQFDHHCDDASKQCRDIYWESTGLNSKSSVRMVELATGKVLKQQPLAQQWFGEGVTKHGDKLYQITWQTPTGFLYEANSELTPVKEFKTPLKDGWGITSDGTHLLLTDGSSKITFVDPATMAAVRSVEVKDGEQSIIFLNELEYIDGEVWANVWQTECIARIDPASGRVKSWVLMHGLKGLTESKRLAQRSPMDVLNGIAHDAQGKRLFVTGKLWPRLYEVKLEHIPGHRVAGSKKLRQRRQSCYSRGWGG